MKKTAVLALLGMLLTAGATAADEVDFNRDVRPILAAKCFICHGPDQGSRQADLRLDTYAGATEHAIVPGSAEDSEVYLRICETDADLRMPPGDSAPALTDQEKSIVRRWIESGAAYQVHWAYQNPTRPPLPAESAWSQDEIDLLVLRQMNAHGLQPSDPADRYTLIRRIALDLTGLPPTPSEVDEFVNDASDSAYASMVDRFLEKPAFGERWAAVWLDHARYADSMGYAEDLPREIWAYRDYVIRSFNQNKPFDQFTVEQLAGDLLPDPTDDQLVATAFHRNTLTNTEGGTIDEEFRSAAVVDRTNTTLAVWMATTMACAQCHDHKYDPISQQEYFQFYAFLNNTEDNDQRDDRPRLDLYSPSNQRRRSELALEIEKWKDELASWIEQPESERASRLAALQHRWERQNTNRPDNRPLGHRVRVQLPKPNAILSLAEIQIFSNGRNVAREGQPSQSSTMLQGTASLAIDDNTNGDFDAGHSVTHTRQESHPWWQVILQQPVPIDEIVIWNRTDHQLFSRSDGLVVSILDEDGQEIWTRLVDRGTEKPHRLPTVAIPYRIVEILRRPDRTAADSEMLRDYFARHHGLEIELKRKIEALEAEYEQIRPTTSVPVMRELPTGKRRETHIHRRGNYLDPGESVDCGTPAVFHDLDSSNPDRLAMARWLVDSRNPLTARVIANRLWQQFFGIGIVATSEEFGTQGDLPTHPELLDYLACELMDSGWNLKHIMKRIVLSATYRQSSQMTRDGLERDPDNRWLSRGPRFRLSAEMIRDQALFSSGLLNPQMFGPPAQPPQPATGLKRAFRDDSTDWVADEDRNRYRRAIYTRWQRSNPYPSLSTFDVSNREVCEVRRLRTNTPLQALITLNDPVFVEAAQALARKTSQQAGDRDEKMQFMFRSVLIRPPQTKEYTILAELYDDALHHFQANAEAAQRLAVDPLHPVGDDTDLVSLAAWTTVANVILNLDESLTRP